MRLFRQLPAIQVATCWLLAFVLVVPMLLAVLPSPVSAEEAALYRDLQNSRCQEQGLPIKGERQHCNHCIMCAPAMVPRASFTTVPLFIFASAPPRSMVPFNIEEPCRATLAAIMTPDPGRGPPA